MQGRVMEFLAAKVASSTGAPPPPAAGGGDGGGVWAAVPPPGSLAEAPDPRVGLLRARGSRMGKGAEERLCPVTSEKT